MLGEKACARALAMENMADIKDKENHMMNVPNIMALFEFRSWKESVSEAFIRYRSSLS